MSDSNQHPIRLFISYSRRDSAFVDQLDADLQERGLHPWVDRERLEGGDEWEPRLEQAIRTSAGVLVVVPPVTANLKWVRREVLMADNHSKLVVPIHIRHEGNAEENAELISLSGVQPVDFADDYQEGFQALLVAIYRRIVFRLPESTGLDGEHPEGGAPPHAESSQDPQLDRLYVTALKTADLEERSSLLDRILAADPGFAKGLAAQQHLALQTDLHKLRFERAVASAKMHEARGDWRQAAGAWQSALAEDAGNQDALSGALHALHRVAEDARRSGRWEEATSALEAILGWAPNDVVASRWLPIVTTNLEWAKVYAYAVALSQEAEQENARAEARRLVEQVWLHAPDFQDPQGIAPGLGLVVPPTLEEREAALQRARQQEETRQQQRREQEEAQRQLADERRKADAMLPRVRLKRSSLTTSPSPGLFAPSAPRTEGPEVTIPRPDLTVGEPFILQYDLELQDKAWVKEIRIYLLCIEEVKYVQERQYEAKDPETGETETRTAHDNKILRLFRICERQVHAGGHFSRGEQITRQQRLQIPPNGMHSLQEGPYTIRWQIQVAVVFEKRAARRVARVAAFDFNVLPIRYA